MSGDARIGGRALDAGGLLALLLSAFGVFGLQAGCGAVLLADLSRSLGLSPGPLGIALFAGALASLAAMATLGWTVDRLGRKAFLVTVTCVLGIEISGLAFTESFWVLVAVLVLFSPAGGLYDVGINAVAVDLERLSGRRFMAGLHAVYSGGAVVGALGAGALLSAGVGYRLVYLALLVPLAAVVAAFVAVRFPRPDRATGDASTESVRDGTEGAGDRIGAKHRDLYRSAPLLLIAAIGTLGLVSEGAMEDWSSIYLRDSLGVGALLGGSGVAVFYGAMAVGRVATAWVVRRLGNRRTLISAGLLAASGMTLALATELPATVVVGFLIVGLAISGMAPLTYSVAGDLVPGRVGAAVSVITTFSYGGGLLATPMIGGLAELVGLRAALGTVALAGLAVFVLSLRLREIG